MLSLNEVQEHMSKLRNWALDGNAIVKDKIFRDFNEAMEFVNKVAEISEKNKHHPSMMIDYNNVRISLTTHQSGGLTITDFDVAKEIDQLGI